MTSDPQPFLHFESVSKRFPGVQALRSVTLDVRRGSCHALVGENGAGKSTLGKILAGIYTPDEGCILLDGRPLRCRTPRDAHLAGIGIVHQELAFCENLSVAENLNLGRLPHRGPFLARRALHEAARAALAAIDCHVAPEALVAELPVGQQQLVQIAGAIAAGARILVFDEPTSSLSQVEAERLFALIRRLPAQGVTALYISHRMEEIFDLCDTATVLRDGELITTRPVADLTRDDLVRMMIGRRLEDTASPPPAARGSELLAITGLSSPGRIRDVSLAVHAGEIVGLAGLVGAGRTEVLEAIFGIDPHARGAFSIGGRALRVDSPDAAMRAGLGLVPEDRKRHGLVLGMSAEANLSLPTLARVARCGWVRRRREQAQARSYFDRLRVRAPSPQTPAASLSGGNQQKLVIAKWLAAECRVLLLDEPTRGVDVGAKAEIHALIRGLARSGGSGILLASSELPELLKLSDRILVMRGGRIVEELARAEADQARVLRLMAGVGAREDQDSQAASATAR